MSLPSVAQQSGALTRLNMYFPGTMSSELPTRGQYDPTVLDPSNLAQVLPSYAQAGQVGPTALQASPNVANAATYSGAQIGPTSLLDPSQISAITQGNSPDLSANATISQILQGFQPEQTLQQGALDQQLAAAGLSGGPAIAAQQNFNNQMTQAIAPAIAQAIQNSQSNQLNQGQFSSNALLQALTGNQSALNQQNQNQAQLTQQAGLANQSALNSQSQLLANLQAQAAAANQSALNSSSQDQAALNQQANLANADAANTANTANVGAVNSTLAANTSAQNAAQQAYLQQLQQQWLDQFSAFNSINDAGLGAQNNIAVSSAQNFGTPTGTSEAYSGLGSALGSLYAPTAKAAPTAPSFTGTATA